MVSLKKQKGFTIVELLIVIIVIGILATLILVTYAGVQSKARDSVRQTDINAIDSHLEVFYAQYGFYPTLCDLQTTTDGFSANCNTNVATGTTFLSAFLRGLDPGGLVSPEGGTIAAVATSAPSWSYGYVAAGTSCSNTTATTITNGVPQGNGCTSFTLTANLENGNPLG